MRVYHCKSLSLYKEKLSGNTDKIALIRIRQYAKVGEYKGQSLQDVSKSTGFKIEELINFGITQESLAGKKRKRKVVK